MKNDHFDAEEATEDAIDERMFLIKRLLKDYSFSKESMGQRMGNEINIL